MTSTNVREQATFNILRGIGKGNRCEPEAWAYAIKRNTAFESSQLVDKEGADMGYVIDKMKEPKKVKTGKMVYTLKRRNPDFNKELPIDRETNQPYLLVAGLYENGTHFSGRTGGPNVPDAEQVIYRVFKNDRAGKSVAA